MLNYHSLARVLAIGFASSSPSIAAVNQRDDAVQDHSQSARALAGAYELAELAQIGTSLEGRAIELLTLAGKGAAPESKPALLITAGIDAQHLVGTSTALGVAQRVLQEHPEVLEQMTIYVIPLVNPDGVFRNQQRLTMGHAGNARNIDQDRDRMSDEDGAEDLNGDGYITMMRRLNPPIQEAPTHMVDPDDPRLNAEPKADKGERASFTLYSEGIDNDGDGMINEDGFDAVDLNGNFMHRWDEYAVDSGKYQLSEPESAALAAFVLGHRNIVMSMSYGLSDNLINTPDTKGKDASGRAPKGIDAADADLYKRVAQLYKDATGQNSVPKSTDEGSFHGWLYAQQGIPSFTSVVWVRPDLEDDTPETDGEDNSDAADKADEPANDGLHPSGVGDISQETIDELIEAYEAETGEAVDESMMAMVTPEMIEGFAAQAGVQVRRIVEPAPESDDSTKESKPKKQPKTEDAKWLAYFDASGVQGFVDWEAFEHPTLGPVEIGGFVPLSRINPPDDQLDRLVDEQAAFVLELIDARPMIEFAGPQVTKISDGLYEVRLAISNDGQMPTTTAFSESKRTIRPMVVRMSAEVDHILSGQRISRVWGIGANGDRSEHHWIIRTSDIERETIEILDPRYGNRTLKLGDLK